MSSREIPMFPFCFYALTDHFSLRTFFWLLQADDMWGMEEEDVALQWEESTSSDDERNAFVDLGESWGFTSSANTGESGARGNAGECVSAEDGAGLEDLAANGILERDENGGVSNVSGWHYDTERDTHGSRGEVGHGSYGDARNGFVWDAAFVAAYASVVDGWEWSWLVNEAWGSLGRAAMVK